MGAKSWGKNVMILIQMMEMVALQNVKLNIYTNVKVVVKIKKIHAPLNVGMVLKPQLKNVMMEIVLVVRDVK